MKSREIQGGRKCIQTAVKGTTHTAHVDSLSRLFFSPLLFRLQRIRTPHAAQSNRPLINSLSLSHSLSQTHTQTHSLTHSLSLSLTRSLASLLLYVTPRSVSTIVLQDRCCAPGVGETDTGMCSMTPESTNHTQEMQTYII